MADRKPPTPKVITHPIPKTIKTAPNAGKVVPKGDKG
jgi:hypothetical protein